MTVKITRLGCQPSGWEVGAFLLLCHLKCPGQGGIGGPGSNWSGELDCLVTHDVGGMSSKKIDVDNRPSTDKLHHFVQKKEEKKKKKKVTCDT